MIYKGYVIEPQYLPGSDFRILNDGRMVERKPTIQDVDFYLVTDAETGWCLGHFNRWGEAKDAIDDLNEKLEELV